VSVTVPAERAETARARMLDLFPAGFEEREDDGSVELIAYTSGDGEERMWQAFGAADSADVEAGWEDRWRSFHRPVVAGGLWIGPPWETPDDGLPAVTIDPGRAFGTGAHPTTRLCLELLAARPPGSVLDVGCGSGVLSIAAARLGHGPVTAVDHDPVAIDVARENAAGNGVDLEAIVLDASAGELPAADLVLANIAPEPVAALSGRLRCGAAITSGYLVSDRPALAGFELAERRELDGWAADLHLPRPQ
jgi:ribosomal protein L11 methyltransferase